MTLWKESLPVPEQKKYHSTRIANKKISLHNLIEYQILHEIYTSR